MIIIPIPEEDFDPSETSIPWKILTNHQIKVQFSTPNGKPGHADERMLKGTGLGILKKSLMANSDALACYAEMEKDISFLNPIPYDQIKEEQFAGMILPGGHAKGMKPYLESKVLQNLIVKFFKNNKPVGAICHGVLLVARSIDPNTNLSILNDYHTTSLLKRQELLAYHLTRLWLGDYYLTYPITVEDEIKTFLKEKDQFHRGNIGLIRDSEHNLNSGFTVLDRNFLSARWPGDAHKFSYDFINLLNH
ncbi:MAG: type 1 glutamine amidotransferase domain-containing protein [Leptospira sp.]|nr:type 1 glutamine amidotransferase domain-containing protein [Leptospira sp.]